MQKQVEEEIKRILGEMKSKTWSPSALKDAAIAVNTLTNTLEAMVDSGLGKD